MVLANVFPVGAISRALVPVLKHVLGAARRERDLPVDDVVVLVSVGRVEEGRLRLGLLSLGLFRLGFLPLDAEDSHVEGAEVTRENLPGSRQVDEHERNADEGVCDGGDFSPGRPGGDVPVT